MRFAAFSLPPLSPASLVIASALAMAGTSVVPALAETITVDGESYEDAEMAEVGQEGVWYRVGPEEFVVVPWAELNQFQTANVKSRFADSLEHLRHQALWVKGTVFDRNSDGIIVQTEIDLDAGEAKAADSGLPQYENGGAIAHGMVLITDLKDNAIRKNGDPVEGIFYQRGTFTYEMAGFNLVKEIPECTEAKPEWASVREWTNREGNKLTAKVIATRDGKCLFEKADGSTFPYEIASLSDDDQALVAQFEKRALAIPVF